MNAVFFDMDGTLIDSRADLASAVNFTRVDLGLAPLPQEQVVSFVGCGARYLLENAIPEITGRFDELWPQFSANYQAHMLDATTLYPGVRRTLAELADRGWLMGINTNKPNFATAGILEHFGLKRYFGAAVIAGGDCVEMKPSGLPLRECAARMRGHRLSAHDWMVGDNWTDMESGTNAGVKTAFCTFGFGHLRESRYTIKINRFEELLRYLKPED
ncbi:MAG: HAD hydrolase-like protein [Kiritimatiellae bacterium]|nr:HAD hydrolase-like protein [Kiritimatiellia bacterium]